MSLRKSTKNSIQEKKIDPLPKDTDTFVIGIKTLRVGI
jgi:hypothetical protein